MIHGGGHCMLSRKDIRPEQTQMLLDAGFLPVSIDYRLCPETTLVAGPMTDARDALAWCRNTLPSLALQRRDITPSKTTVVAIGWSTGGTVALSLGWTAPAVGLAPPQATLVFYCPSDYEDPCWYAPNKPFGDDALAAAKYDLCDGVSEAPIVAYNPPGAAKAAGGWAAKGDARSRIVLHMNWHGQTVQVLTQGLSKGTRGAGLLPRPSEAEIQAVSPLAQIRMGKYRTPTFIVHPVNDDLIPWEQAKRTADELKRNGVEAELRLVPDAIHLFDMYPRYKKSPEAAQSVMDGYDFLSAHV